MPQLDTIIFDLDGTLIDSAPDLHAAANAMLSQLGRDMLDLPSVIRFIGNGVEVLVERALRATGGLPDDGVEPALTLFRTFYNQNMTVLTRPYPGVIDQLLHLQARGIAMAVCTNKPTAPATTICDDLGLTGFFSHIRGAEDGTPKKPHPAPLLACLAKLGARPETSLYVGDSEVDFQTARNAGVTFALFSGGYLNAPLPDLELSDRFDQWQTADLANRRIAGVQE